MARRYRFYLRVIKAIYYVISNTRKSVSSGYPNTEKFVENRGEAEVFEQISRYLDILIKHTLPSV